MKYAVCTKCGRRLFKGETGTKVEMECPKCGAFISVVIDTDNLRISDKPLTSKDRSLPTGTNA